MPEPIGPEQVANAILALLQESFETVEGIYLDRGTSLFETLETLTAEQVSRPIVDGGTTIAGHVYHVRFYLQAIRDYMEGKSQPNLDWKQSWVVKTVNEAEWKDLREKLADERDCIVREITETVDWNDERRLGGSMGIIAHTAFHLGAIRQMRRVILG